MFYRVAKRSFDLFFGIILWILTSPLMLLIALVIKLSDGGDVFVGAPLRKGLNGESFYMLKFRTMVSNAHSRTMSDEKSKEELLSKHKLNGDSRVTKVGRFLRNTDLDELPQFINVIIGNMSLVGPRPLFEEEYEYHIEKFPQDVEYFREIFKVKPGITGIWQVSGRNSIPIRDRLKMESEYISHPSLLKDLYIFLQTPWVVITRRGVKGSNV